MESLQVEARWQGPFGWPGLSAGLPAPPNLPGVYLLTVDYRQGFLIFAAGITRRSIAARLREHTRKYREGVYNVLDAEALRAGKRLLVWQGYWMKPRKPDRVVEFETRKAEVGAAVDAQLEAFRVFVANITVEGRILERLEAAIMEHLYRQMSPFCDVPDRGMMLAPRRQAEAEIEVFNRASVVLHTLPETMLI